MLKSCSLYLSLFVYVSLASADSPVDCGTTDLGEGVFIFNSCTDYHFALALRDWIKGHPGTQVVAMTPMLSTPGQGRVGVSGYIVTTQPKN